MIIIEGADAVGKTTAAQTLCKLIQARFRTDATVRELYRHMSKPSDDFDHFSDYVTLIHEGVQDRFHLGAMVYGKMLGCGRYPTSRKMRCLQRYLRWTGCVTVILTGERKWLSDQLEKSPKTEMYAKEQILDANECYKALATSHNRGENWADIWLDVTTEWPSEKVLSGVIETWRTRWTA